VASGGDELPPVRCLSQHDFVARNFFNATFRSQPSVRQLTHLGDDVLSDPTKNIYPVKG
jgi:hypothetical protein